MAAALEGLDEENSQAWGIYRQLVSRLAADLTAGGEVLRRLTAHVPDEDWPDLWRRLVLLYQTLNPPPATKD